MSIKWMFRSVWIAVGVAVVAVLAVGLTQKWTDDPKTSDKSTSLNPGDAYRACVEDASDRLYSMVPGITRAQAVEQAQTSPRCSPLSTSAAPTSVSSKSDTNSASNQKYLSCMETAADALYSMIPGITREEASDPARANAMCSSHR